jgi:hypothetical protein
MQQQKGNTMLNHLCPNNHRCRKTETDSRMLRNALLSHARKLSGQVAQALKQGDRESLICIKAALQEHAAIRKAMAPYIQREGLVIDLERKIHLVDKALNALTNGQKEDDDDA